MSWCLLQKNRFKNLFWFLCGCSTLTLLSSSVGLENEKELLATSQVCTVITATEALHKQNSYWLWSGCRFCKGQDSAADGTCCHLRNQQASLMKSLGDTWALKALQDTLQHLCSGSWFPHKKPVWNELRWACLRHAKKLQGLHVGFSWVNTREPQSCMYNS